jgi:hypothetical protein
MSLASTPVSTNPTSHKNSSPHQRSLLQRVKTRLVTALGGNPSKKKKGPSLDEILARLDRIDRVCKEEYTHLCKMRREKHVEVTEPLVLISQIQRSGGTLLSQLFDGHPQCHAHPYELFIGYPKKMYWPTLDLKDTPASWFKTLFEKPVLRAFEQGYTKYGKGIEEDLEIFPFVFLPSLQKAIFNDCVAAKPIGSARDIFNCYMTSYFNAWLDNQNLYGKKKRLITAFVPRMGMDEANLQRFFGTYPDGKLLSIIRDPKSWWVSARKHKPAVYGDLEKALDLWIASTEAVLAARRSYGSSVKVLKFEDLVTDTEGTMRGVAGFLNLDFHDCLLTPTFNGFPIKADSSYKVQGYGVIKDPVTRHKELLTPAETGRIEERTRSTYAAALEMIGTK